MQIKMNAEAISAGPLPPVTIPWVDKYAPKTIDSVIGQAGQKSPANKLLSWLTEWTPKVGAQGALCALISGPPGIGKTTIAKLAAKALNMETVELNASDARSAKILKSKYLESMKSETLSPNKKVIINSRIYFDIRLEFNKEMDIRQQGWFRAGLDYTRPAGRMRPARPFERKISIIVRKILREFARY